MKGGKKNHQNQVLLLDMLWTLHSNFAEDTET